ncbi:MAG TPA: VOC family protein [Bryobacteraceae bacterium]|nr:VOC family protein [Bryobacteraceae bacterium]
MRLHRAMIYVKDLPKMTAFYNETLGLRRTDDGRFVSWVEFDAGGARFALHAIPEDIAKQIEISSPPRAREKDPVKLVFEVDDVEAERARLASLGVAMVQRPWGSWDGIDPEGNIFGIVDPERLRLDR